VPHSSSPAIIAETAALIPIFEKVRVGANSLSSLIGFHDGSTTISCHGRFGGVNDASKGIRCWSGVDNGLADHGAGTAVGDTRYPND
jgi:hypothetical protein